jgi:ribosomal protein S8
VNAKAAMSFMRPKETSAERVYEMAKFKSDFLRVMHERGFIHQISDESGLDELFSKEIVSPISASIRRLQVCMRAA